MPRNKRNPGVLETKTDRNTRETQRQLQLPLRPKEDPPLPNVPFKEMKRILSEKAKSRVVEEAMTIPLPNEDDEGAPKDPELEELVEKYGKISKQWNMYLTNKPDKRVMLLRYPEKTPGSLYSAGTGQKPIELRIKTNFNLIELDVPMDPHNPSYDKVRGIIYGEALRKSKILKEKGGAYGAAGGFGLGGATQDRGKGRAGQAAEDDGPSIDDLLADYDNAVKNGHVMDKMTLGGHIFVPGADDPNYFFAAFKGPNLYLTKVDAICVLRPQLVHIDALNEQKKSTLRMQPGVDTEENEAVNVSMSIKNTEGKSEETSSDAGDIAKLLKAMREEPWQRMSWVDSEDEAAYLYFQENFFQKNKEEMPDLQCTMTKEQWLDVISCPRIDPLNPNKHSMTTGNGDDDLSSTESEGDYEEYTDSEVEEAVYSDAEDDEDCWEEEEEEEENEEEGAGDVLGGAGAADGAKTDGGAEENKDDGEGNAHGAH